MSTIAAYGRKAAADRPGTRRLPRIPALASALALAALAPGFAPEAAAQSRSGITINNDVLNSLGPGPAAAPVAPLAPSWQPGEPWDGQLDSQPVGLAPAFPPADGGNGGFSSDPYGSGNVVVTRPGTLLFPPLQAPTSTLTSGFDSDADNRDARARALGSAFAEGPEPNSQLLIPLDGAPPAAGNSSVMVFMDRLPPADPNADPAAAPVLVLQVPPQPAPRKPAVPDEVLAELQQPRAEEEPAELAPEFVTPEFVTPEPPAMAELAPEVPVEQSPLANAEPPAADLAIAEPAAADLAAAEPAAEPTPLGGAAMPAAVAEIPQAEMPQAEMSQAEMSGAEMSGAEMSQADTAMAAAPASPPAGDDAPVSLLPATPAGLQTASLTVGAIGDMTFLFEVDSAELSAEAQSELRALAEALHGDGSDIQVLGFASGQDASEDQARKLALSRALKVRSFLIDAGIASARIRVRSLGDRADGGPANRVDIMPIGS